MVSLTFLKYTKLEFKVIAYLYLLIYLHILQHGAYLYILFERNYTKILKILTYNMELFLLILTLVFQQIKRIISIKQVFFKHYKNLTFYALIHKVKVSLLSLWRKFKYLFSLFDFVLS